MAGVNGTELRGSHFQRDVLLPLHQIDALHRTCADAELPRDRLEPHAGDTQLKDAVIQAGELCRLGSVKQPDFQSRDFPYASQTACQSAGMAQLLGLIRHYPLSIEQGLVAGRPYLP